MDPALRELLRRGADDDLVEVVVRFHDASAPVPRDLRLVSRFGTIATARARRAEIAALRDHPSIASVKAPRLIAPEEAITGEEDLVPREHDRRRPDGLAQRGRGTVLAVLDWGLDFANAAFRRADGATRLLALWDQRGAAAQPGNRYGYGRILTRGAIDDALAAADPYAALGYHPGDADPGGVGAHGTATLDLAAGNGRSGTPEGVAPAADLVFVHLASRGTHGLASLGDSVGILEGLDFVQRVAGDRPTVLSLSVGRHGGPHDGTSLVELAFDAFLTGRSGRFLAQSAGNYRQRQTHLSARVTPGAVKKFPLLVEALDPTSNELELWHDVEPCSIRLDAPDGATSGWVPLSAIGEVGSEPPIARVYHRRGDPQNGSNQAELFIGAGAPAGEWTVSFRDERVDGPIRELHAWIERDDSSSGSQSRFRREDADPACTLGTLATNRHGLVCAAYDSIDPRRPSAPFSSLGPTRDGRTDRPSLAAPGVGLLVVRSASRAPGSAPPFVRKSGTSMAAPQAAGCAALVLEASGGQLWSAEVSELLLATAEPLGSPEDAREMGAGYLDVAAAVAASASGRRRRARRRLAAAESIIPGSKEERMSTVRDLERMLGLLTDGDGLFGRWTRGLGDDGWALLGAPGQTPRSSPRPGDVLVRVALGEPGRGHVALLVGDLAPARELGAGGFALEDSEEGFFGQVADGGAFPHTRSHRFARRVLDRSGRLPAGQLLLRPAPVQPPTELPPEPPPDLDPGLPPEEPAESDASVTFPSGVSLRVVTGYPEGPDEDYWDPVGSGNPLLDTRKDEKLSEHFTVRELAGRQGTEVARIDPKLVEALEKLRQHVGRPITFNSAYRSWKHNKQVYGDRKPTHSQHCAGRAADVKVEGLDAVAVAKAAIDAIGPAIGIGLHPAFTHIDVRGTPAVWPYAKVTPDAWVAEVVRYQRARLPPGTKSRAPKGSRARTPGEVVRFAQRVLNAAEGERLQTDGAAGPLTNAAIERFRAKFGLGTGHDLDEPTQLALAQRALEELAQQSLFRKGARDEATDRAIGELRARAGLPAGSDLDAPTRAALADALERRGTGVAAPSGTAPGTTNWARVPEGDRMRHVMKLLVEKYGYPVNGAAGIVGNLYAESQVIPNRIEGSDAASPMTAEDFQGRPRTFTPEEVMNRVDQKDRKEGPRLPGVGLAQWTKSSRRRGLFQHAYGGRVLGAGILWDMDAQVDYLASELRARYPDVDAFLRSSAVTADDACDEVVYSFEIPGAVVDEKAMNELKRMGVKAPEPPPRLARDHKSVVAVFKERRKLAHRALDAWKKAGG